MSSTLGLPQSAAPACPHHCTLLAWAQGTTLAPASTQGQGGGHGKGPWTEPAPYTGLSLAMAGLEALAVCPRSTKPTNNPNPAIRVQAGWAGASPDAGTGGWDPCVHGTRDRFPSLLWRSFSIPSGCQSRAQLMQSCWHPGVDFDQHPGQPGSVALVGFGSRAGPCASGFPDPPGHRRPVPLGAGMGLSWQRHSAFLVDVGRAWAKQELSPIPTARGLGCAELSGAGHWSPKALECVPVVAPPWRAA